MTLERNFYYIKIKESPVVSSFLTQVKSFLNIKNIPFYLDDAAE